MKTGRPFFGLKSMEQQQRLRLQKHHLKSEVTPLQTLSRLFHLVQYVKCWQFFVELNSKRLYQSSGERKESCCLVFTPPQNVKLGIRELKNQTFLIHERHGGPRRTESETRFACQMQIIKQNNVKPSRTPTE